MGSGGTSTSKYQSRYTERMLSALVAWFRRRLIQPLVAPFEEQLQLQKKALELERSQHANTAQLLRESFHHGPAGPDQFFRGLQSEVNEAEALGGGGPGMNVAIKERWWDMELALEDRGWARQISQATTEFSRYGLQRIILICRLYFLKNPLFNRGVRLHSYYTFGRGIEIYSEDESVNEAIEEFLEDNAKELGHAGLCAKEETLQTDGNLFYVFFPDRITGRCQVRTIDAIEIQEIITDPDDASVPWLYLRQWSSKVLEGFGDGRDGGGWLNLKPLQAWYPAVGYDPPTKDKVLRGFPINWGTPIYHDKIGGQPKWLFGCPPSYTALDWCRAAKNNLEDWATITRALARFAWNVETTGGNQAISNLQAALATTLADGAATVETNPPPVVGSTFITGPGNKLSPVKTAGATTKPDEVRRLVLMVAAAFGLPETFFGDASVGTVATAQSLDRPTELKFMNRQEHWKESLQVVVGYAMSVNIKSPGGKLREAMATKGKDPDDRIKINVTFPSVLEHDIGEMVTAITTAATLQGYQPANTVDMRTLSKMLLSELGVEDVDAIVDAMYPPDKFDAEVPPPPTPEDLAAQQAQQPKPGEPAQNKQAAKEAALVAQWIKAGAALIESRK